MKPTQKMKCFYAVMGLCQVLPVTSAILHLYSAEWTFANLKSDTTLYGVASATIVTLCLTGWYRESTWELRE